MLKTFEKWPFFRPSC